MEPPEIVSVDTPHVSCDGGNGPLGHPLVYLEMGAKTAIDCPYCGRRFVLSANGDKAASAGH